MTDLAELYAVRDTIWGQLGYAPSLEQAAAHNSPTGLKIVAGGERSGKSFSASKEATWQIMRFGAMQVKEVGPNRAALERTDGLWWVVGPTYELARPEFQYIVEDLTRLGAVTKKNISLPKEGACEIRLPWGTVITKSGEDARKIAAVAPDGIVVCETAQLDYYTWLKILGRAIEKRAWIWASGTFEGSFGWYPEKWREWQGQNTMGGQSFSVPTWSNLSIFPKGREDPEIKKLEGEYPEDMFMERFGAVPCPPASLVFKEFNHTKHVVRMTQAKEFAWIHSETGELEAIELPWEHEVQVWIDPGRWGYAVEAVMVIGENVFNFDEVFCTEMSAEQVIRECEKRSWWRRVKLGVMDIAGSQKHAGQSHKEIWTTKAGIPIVDQKVGITDGIDRHRTFLQGRLYHSPNCTEVIREYGLYKYRDVKDENRPRSDVPIDAHNHAMKAFAYGLVYNFGFVKRLNQGDLWEWPFATPVANPFYRPPVKSYLPPELR